jgi:hypothetical protein
MSEQVEVITVIHTRLLRRGDGDKTYIRVIDQYWNMQGELMWEVDPLGNNDKVAEG